MENKKIIITTSWDDGFALDIRIAELLEKYKLGGTFYVPINNPQREVMNSAMLVEISKSHEIGGHTVNHTFLNTVDLVTAQYEVSACKAMLEERLGKTIYAFCYPGGKYSQRDIQIVKDAGFLFGRTTKLLHTSIDTSQQLMHTGMQAYNHNNAVLIRHCLKNLYLLPILDYCLFYKNHNKFRVLAEDMLRKLLLNGGVFHLWGHSWEIEKYGLWTELEEVMKILAFHEGISYMNNTECWNFLNKEQS
ncbi:polysaccharide deacetylase [Paludibacter propionicigenes WB4]|uniref:Polysaccharide deacetylase n=1 Tax=Paludibacter propionicigenes (strain DSM 17365 / JCM 13257 / WB4) TaxID=694427 RepID=E4T6X2_PALPW|nr:polysaccharide deacetylase family protein [Paludibacter propionicigenes]ADQ80466.1 polysaccharide deacetylase [Paludibacter propionicigenes WB4]